MEKNNQEFLEALNESYNLNKEYTDSIVNDLENTTKKIEKLEKQKELLKAKALEMGTIMANVKHTVDQLTLFDINEPKKERPMKKVGQK